MFTVELYAGIRRAVMVDGLSRREAAKRPVMGIPTAMLGGKRSFVSTL
jgi:hypothetical protein